MSLSNETLVNWFLDNKGTFNVTYSKKTKTKTNNIWFSHLVWHSAVFWASVCVCVCVSDRVEKRQLRGRWWWICAVTDVKEVPDRLSAAHYSVSLCRIVKAYQRCRFQRQHKHSHTDTHTHARNHTKSYTFTYAHSFHSQQTSQNAYSVLFVCNYKMKKFLARLTIWLQLTQKWEN